MEDQVHRPGLPGARETRPVGSLRRFLPDTKPYRWQFVAEKGHRFSDSGMGSCHPSPPFDGQPSTHLPP